MAESTTTRPKPATTGLPKAWDQLLVVGGEEAGRVEEAVPALVVRAYGVGENDPHGWAEGEYRADLVVFNAHGSAATPYVGTSRTPRAGWTVRPRPGARRKTSARPGAPWSPSSGNRPWSRHGAASTATWSGRGTGRIAAWPRLA
jgi:hypothetical protein